MSQKPGKKLRKRVDDEVEVCVKVSNTENEKEIQEENITENGEKEDKTVIDEIAEEHELNGIKEHNVADEPKQLVQEEITVEIGESKENQIIEHKDIIEIEEDPLKVHVDNIGTENNHAKEENEETENKNVETEIEPLFLEAEEVDPELECEENLDMGSQKTSPVIRCKTRRSQTRSIPTPKTPNVPDTDDTKTSECGGKLSVVQVPTPEIIYYPVTNVHDSNEKLLGKGSDEDIDSLQNVSIRAVTGSDTTRNVDLSAYPDEEFQLSPFLAESRERSVAETLKFLSGRRSIRSSKDYGFEYDVKNEYKMLHSHAKRNTFERLGGVKRRSDNDSPDYTKRFKSDSPHVFSYICNLKSRFTKSEIQSSTPKLTAYKSKNVFDNTDVSKITLNETEDVADKRWCTVM